MKSGSKRTINYNKHQSKVALQRQSQYLDYLIDPGFQGVSRPFVLPFDHNTNTPEHAGYYLLRLEIKDYDVMISGQNVFSQPAKNNLRTYDFIRNKIQLVKETTT